MVVEFYLNSTLAYGNKYRYINLDRFEPFRTNTYKTIIFGDGTECSMKAQTKDFFYKGEPATYIRITTEPDDPEETPVVTRWFVAYWKYLNGKQVEVFLRRDIIGDYGISNMFAQIERGYVSNTNKLKYKQELTLNNRLINRIKLIPSTYQYGTVKVDTHSNELWGILYFINSSSEGSYKVNIPAFAPEAQEDPFNVSEGTYVDGSGFSDEDNTYVQINFTVRLNFSQWRNVVQCLSVLITYYPGNISKTDYGYYSITEEEFYDYNNVSFKIDMRVQNNDDDIGPYIDSIIDMLINYLNEKYNGNITNFAEAFYGDQINYGYKNYNVLSTVASLSGPLYSETDPDTYVKSYFTYNVISKRVSYNNSNVKIQKSFIEDIQNNCLTLSNLQNNITNAYREVNFTIDDTTRWTNNANLYYYYYTVTKSYKSSATTGTIEITANQELVFEPFQILVCPLFDCSLQYTESGTTTTYKIERQAAFNIFNTVISSLSGDSAYILDAQLYPYCPVLSNIACYLKESDISFPFFNVASQSYYHNINVELPQANDVKYEYDMHTYRMVSPDQSGTYDFKYYDYKNSEDEDKTLTIEIKTCLKPYTMVTSAIILRDENSTPLIGITYESDMRGADCTGKGFEATMTSNAFETYARENSNYQELYDLSKEELTLSQEVERKSELTSVITNTIASAGYGATAGSSMLSGLGGIGSMIGGIGGAALGATAAGVAGYEEIKANDEMREFEQYQLEAEFNYNLQTIKNIPDSLNQISSFNDILLYDFWYIIEVYDCTMEEAMIDINYYSKYAYELGICGQLSDYVESGKFIKATILQCNLPVQYTNLLNEDLSGGVYIILNEEENNNGGESEL